MSRFAARASISFSRQFLACCLFLMGVTAFAAVGDLDATFNTGTGPSSAVNAIAIQADGKAVIGGTFTTINGVARNRIARLNSNGSLDAVFSPGTGADGAVSEVVVQADGKVLIGGAFTTINGVARSRIARLNSNGSLDSTFASAVGAGANGVVSEVAVQADGKVLIGGAFTTINGVTSNRIARLNSDGSLDTTFNSGTGASNNVSAISVQNDGKILIGGRFTTFNGVERKKIARLNNDGSLDTTFIPGDAISNSFTEIFTIAVQSDGKIILGGGISFITTSGVIIRLNDNGSLDSGFTASVDKIINDLVVLANGKIAIGGVFTTVNTTSRNRVAVLNSNGTLDTVFNPATGTNNTINSVDLQTDGKLLIGGSFTTYNGTAANYIARIDPGGLSNDNDGDGVINTSDNCPSIYNANQLNADGDAQGDACDSDDDNDGVADGSDKWPLDPAEAYDADNDGIGNNADIDDDNDGAPDVSDPFPLNPLYSVDVDHDTLPDNWETAHGRDPNVADYTIYTQYVSSISNYAVCAKDDVGARCWDFSGNLLGITPFTSNDYSKPAFFSGTCDLLSSYPLQEGTCTGVLPSYAATTNCKYYDAATDYVSCDTACSGYVHEDTYFGGQLQYCTNIPRTVNYSNGDPNARICHFDAGGFRCYAVDALGKQTGAPLNIPINFVIDSDADGSARPNDPDDLDPAVAGSDVDGDGVFDAVDNCSTVSNTNQLNTDGDAEGDACDNDDDNDGAVDGSDNCPLNANANQLNADGDSQGNVCDAFPSNPLYSADADHDTLPDNWELAHSRDPAKPDYAVSTSSGHQCAVDEDGIKCWGNNNAGQLNVPAALSHPYSVTTGSNWSCACDDNGSQCWGSGYPATPSCGISTTGSTTQLSNYGVGTCFGGGVGNVPRGYNASTQCSIAANGDVLCDTAGAYEIAPRLEPIVAYTCNWTTGQITGEDKTFSPGNVRQLSQVSRNLCMLSDKGVECFYLGYGGTNASTVTLPVSPVALTNLRIDSDGDGVPRPVDTNDLDASVSGDIDSDGVNSFIDNCASISNADQLDADGDAKGDVCDDDDDNDGVPDISDSFPLDNMQAGDVDGDGIESLLDNCPYTVNADQLNTDNDAEGNACDGDDDNDGVADFPDKFPLNAAASSDTDADGFPNSWNAACDVACQTDSGLALDNCPSNANADQLDSDGDAQGNVCDSDDDNDGVADSSDTYPLNPLYSADVDRDTLPDNWETTHGRDPAKADYAISTSATHACAIDEAGVKCWGDNTNGKLTVPATLVHPYAVTTGSSWSCACDDNGSQCWGSGYPASPSCAVSTAGATATVVFDGGGGCGSQAQTHPPGYSVYSTCGINSSGDVACDTSGTLKDYPIISIENFYTCNWTTYSITGEDKLFTPGHARQLSQSDKRLCMLGDKGIQCNALAATAVGHPVTNISATDFTLTSIFIDSDGDGVPRPIDSDDLDASISGDFDSDGVDSVTDNCPTVSNASQTDIDSDGIGDACDSNFDTDSDGINNATDNCSSISNADQLNTDGDSEGNACDADDDNDGVADATDAFPLDATESVDTDGDGVGNNTDTTPNGDTDNDGIDNLTDNCPSVSNADQSNTDGDAQGDACDTTPNGDTDNDGVDNLADNCVSVSNASQLDTDTDGIGDACDNTVNGDTDNDGIDNLTDNCPSVSNANQSNADGDAQGDACDTTPNGDTDNDGVDDLADNCVSVSNANQLDTDTDGMGDACDSTVNGDTDNDGIDNLSDNCPSVSNANQSNADGDAQGDACDTTPNGDTDGDGVDNSSDNCIAVSNADQLDTDNDGAGDLCDLFPDDELLLLEQNGVAKNEQLASSVAMADMNNDGVVDVLVGAPLANVLVEGKILKKAGVIRIVSGKDNSILRTLNGAVANQQFGTAIAVVSDQNSDGVPDVVAGEPLADIAIAIKGKTRTIKSAGRVALYSGSNGERLSVIAEGNNTGDRFGAAVAVHDINNDAQPDLIVGAPLADAMVKDGGQVTVFNGISSSVLYRRQGDQAGEQFGAAVAANNQYLFVGSPLRDVLVPGKGNVVIDKDAGQVSVFSLSNNPSLLARLTGAAQNDHFGAAVSASDVHWAVGIPLSDNALPGDLLPEKAGKDTGSVQLFAGMNITPIAILKGSSAGDNYGSALNMQGDVNGDGRHDVAVGAAKFDVSSIAARRKAAGTRTILLKDAGRVEVLSGVALEGM
jgi:uncharacterized delta-60 repeat protein